MKKKRYEDGGLTFTEMSDEDRAASAKAAIEALNARQAAKSEEAGGASEVKSTPVRRSTSYDTTEAKRNLARAGSEHASGKPAPKEVKAEAPPPRAERAPSSVKPEPITGPKPAKSAESAMPDVAARKAATAERTSRRSAFGDDQKFMGKTEAAKTEPKTEKKSALSDLADIFRRAPKTGMKKGGSVKKMASGGSVSSASKRADGCAVRGKTRGMMR